MLFGFGKKEEEKQALFKTSLTDKEDLEEIKKIASRLEQDEEVLLVAKHSRIKPGGSVIATPNVIFATDRRVIIRNPTMLGMRENIDDISYDKITSVKLEKGVFSATILIRARGLSEMSRLSKPSGLLAWGREGDGQIDAIPKDKAEQLLIIIKQRMERAKKAAQQTSTIVNQQVPVADELAKIAKLKEQGILLEAEFQQMKQKLLKKL
jgi:PH (Pleckstrin Homology) domain-containing protein